MKLYHAESVAVTRDKDENEPRNWRGELAAPARKVKEESSRHFPDDLAGLALSTFPALHTLVRSNKVRITEPNLLIGTCPT
jgi:hypothetical protein